MNLWEFAIISCIILMMYASDLEAQKTQVKLPGNDAQVSFTVTDNSSNDLFEVLGDGRVAIGTNARANTQLTLQSPSGRSALYIQGSSSTEPLVQILGGSVFVAHRIFAGQDHPALTDGTIQGVHGHPFNSGSGVAGVSTSPVGTGVSGYADSQTGKTFGVYGWCGSQDGYGVYGFNRGRYGSLAGPSYGVEGSSGYFDKTVGIALAGGATLSVKDDIGWGISSVTSVLHSDHGGAIELGGTNSKANINSGGTPYLDFHYGNSQVEDYNYRIINNANQSLAFVSAGGITSMTLSSGDVYIDGHIYQHWGSYYRIQKNDTTGNAFFVAPSDRRLKKDVAIIPNALSQVQQLRGVTYQWNEKGLAYHTKDIERTWKSTTGSAEDDVALWEEKRAEMVSDIAGPKIGFVAQEVEEVFPQWVVEEDGIKKIDMRELNAVLVEAVKELSIQNQKQHAKLVQLTEQISKQNSRIGELERSMVLRDEERASMPRYGTLTVSSK